MAAGDGGAPCEEVRRCPIVPGTPAHAPTVYRLASPLAALDPFVHSYWTVRARPDQPVDLSVEVFVDGRADLIFTFGAPYLRQAHGEAARVIRRSNLDAQRLVPIRIVQRGDVFVVGVRFKTGGLSPFIRDPADRWTGQLVDPSEAFGAEAARLERDLQGADADFDQQVRLLDAFLSRRFALSPAQRTVLTVKDAIESAYGTVGIEALGRASGTSPRHLTRLFRNHIGFGPKMLARITRFQRALAMLADGYGGSMAELALACGFYDQAHLARDFRRFSGQPPARQVGYFPAEVPRDFSPNLVRFVQDGPAA